ncbi:MAG TPA: MaoC family dehydratase N-terminal domain-containing protein [Mycobacteriales bacterium]|nr:MaoC family dehydratase N-terminal domain-containing protein [Mycobacteriales bacterium]
MPLNRAFIGRRYEAPDEYLVGREHIRSFATAIGDLNPLSRDVAAARAAGYPDVVAPPTFLTVLGFRFRDASPMNDADLGLNHGRVVHGEQEFIAHRPVYAGDVLRVVNTVTDIRDAGTNELMETTMEVTLADGTAVATLTSSLISRGTAERAVAS